LRAIVLGSLGPPAAAPAAAAELEASSSPPSPMAEASSWGRKRRVCVGKGTEHRAEQKGGEASFTRLLRRASVGGGGWMRWALRELNEARRHRESCLSRQRARLGRGYQDQRSTRDRRWGRDGPPWVLLTVGVGPGGGESSRVW
jgi:hypothetical protein